MKTIPVSGGKYHAIVDDEDFELLSRYTWYLHPHRSKGPIYARAQIKIEGGWYKLMYMHRLILNPPDGMVVDHRNQDGLDNRKSNLRVCTQAQNLANRRHYRDSTKFKGVSRPAGCNYLLMKVGPRGKQYFEKFPLDQDIQAAKAYDFHAKRIFGEFAYQNFPQDDKKAA